ncbi:hypothetical protein Tco_0937908 [Tanacetum coccineum]|uniref:Uncharacterized protein n=1 Tax=Tanacetum coccineum TaxID=301880 RepID=A0ABQ5DHJ4_9ASTR
MMTYLKHVGNFKHSELKIKKFEEIQALYEKIKRLDEDFISIGSAEDERLIKRMNEKGIDSSKSEVIKKESKEEVQEESKEEVKEESSTVLQISLAIRHISNIDNMYIKPYSLSLFSSLPAIHSGVVSPLATRNSQLTLLQLRVAWS